MVKLNSITLLLLPSIILLQFGHLSEVRQKRVLFGREGERGDRDYVPSYRYFVFLSHTKPAWIWRTLGILVSPDQEDLVCGGSILTPFIVLTAAHCVGERIQDGSKRNALKRASLFEHPLFSYVGHNLRTKMKYWVDPKVYATATSAVYLDFGGRTVSGYLDDFGLVLLKNSIADEVPKAKISYAPSYPDKDIVEFFDEVLQNEYMCLHIGHGLWKVSNSDRPEVDIVTSDPIRWGWRTVMNEDDCEYVTYPRGDRYPGDGFNYTKENTWVCSQTTHRHKKVDDLLYNGGRGDSGGPFTCNHVLFGVLSKGSTIAATNIITWDTPILYSRFYIGSEYRADFIAYYKGIADAATDANLRSLTSPPRFAVSDPLLLYILVLLTYL
ncbi:hypothetical protein GE061_009590 [Apolygus lucorum]|uniref:Uncharacterized protein n=1 Tax=Apolygus lucorum TaxID=248454 RepID=A0A6A4KIH7_APOLU|nr:hypothetical protein GE061_009590 [Apolygus lucorum]